MSIIEIRKRKVIARITFYKALESYIVWSEAKHKNKVTYFRWNGGKRMNLTKAKQILEKGRNETRT